MYADQTNCAAIAGRTGMTGIVSMMDASSRLYALAILLELKLYSYGHE